jgi:hypothetical protein
LFGKKSEWCEKKNCPLRGLLLQKHPAWRRFIECVRYLTNAADHTRWKFGLAALYLLAIAARQLRNDIQNRGRKLQKSYNE